MQTATKRILAALLVCSRWLPGLNAQQSELQSDRAHRDFAIRWPAAYDPSVAPVFSHNALLIHTRCHHAFARLADATDWPNWLILVKDVISETPDNTGQGALYRLKIFNSPIQSRIIDFVADERISWIPFGADETESRHGHYHAWLFVPQAGNCMVVTEETGIGPGDIKNAAKGSHIMHKAHELWLESLKYTSEP